MSEKQTTLTFSPASGYQIGDIVMCPAFPPTRWERVVHWWRGTPPPKQIAYKVISATTAEPCE